MIILKFFWTDHTHVPLVPVRNSFLNEYKVLNNLVWCGFYIMAVVVFTTHAAEFDMIHPPDVVEKYAPDPVIGALGDGGEGDDEENDFSEGGCTLEEVAKYSKEDDEWVVLGLLVPVSWRPIQPSSPCSTLLMWLKSTLQMRSGVLSAMARRKGQGAAKLALPAATDMGDPVAHLEA